jgi:thioredoxin-related protein
MRSILIGLILVFNTLFAQMNGLNIIEDYDNAVSIAKKQNKNIFLFVHSTYCPYCEKMKKTTLSNKDVIKFINNKYIFTMLNLEIDDIPEKFKPRFTPTTFIVNPKDEQSIYELYGYKSSKQLLEELKD